MVFDDERHVHAAELVIVFREIKLEAIHHVLADLGKDAGHRRDVTDAQFLSIGLRGQTQTEGKTTAEQYLLQFVRHQHSSLVAMAFPLQLRKAS